MIHTMVVSCQITSDMYCRMCEVLMIQKKNGVSSSIEYNNSGFREIQMIKSTGEYRYYGVNIILNPAVLIRKENKIGTMSFEDVDNVELAFDELIDHIFYESIGLPGFEKWKCRRIDFTVDIKTDYVREYIMLFKKGDKAGSTFDSSYERQGSYYKKSNSVGINFYDKADQLSKKIERGIPGTTEDDLRQVQNILRIEIQCELSKINGIKNKYDLDGRNIKYFMQPEIARQVILYYYDRIIGSGDYYKAYDAARIIMKNEIISKKVKHNSLNTIQLIAQARSIWKGREQFIEGVKIKNTKPPITLKGGKATFNTRLKIIRELGINPVVIPRDWNIDYLPSIQEEIEKQLLS